LIVVIKLFFNVTRGLGEEVDREGDGLIEKWGEGIAGDTEELIQTPFPMVNDGEEECEWKEVSKEMEVGGSVKGWIDDWFIFELAEELPKSQCCAGVWKIVSMVRLLLEICSLSKGIQDGEDVKMSWWGNNGESKELRNGLGTEV
jgi:hypothetical protein